jgi:hypothetical protein
VRGLPLGLPIGFLILVLVFLSIQKL